MIKIKINNNEYEVEPGRTIIQVCDDLNIEIPRFCYHEKLAISGNCRMCLVEVEKMPKPIASCTHPISDGMSIHTNSLMTKKAREGVMEFLLINHPLDCPICDQGGECDLQDQSMKYGNGKSRYMDEKRAVQDKDMGPLIKTHMTRCIHCTRCVRFLEEIGGTYELGAVNRGEHMEVTTYIEKGISSELSGNIIDLCPVGALTSKPYAFKARSWELKHTRSIDIMDGVGSNIRVDTCGSEVMRILPIANEDINEEWLADKGRFSYDGLKYQRLDTPMIKVDGQLREYSWQTAYKIINHYINKINSDKIGSIAGQLTDVETMFVMKKFLNEIGSKNYDCRPENFTMQLNNKNRGLYIVNTGIAQMEEADAFLIIGCNPRYDAPLLNTRIRKATLYNNASVWLLGEKCNLNYKYEYLNDDVIALDKILSGQIKCLDKLKQCKKPAIIIGADIFKRSDADMIMNYAKVISAKANMIREDWNGFNILHNYASQVGGIDIGFVPYHHSFNDSINDTNNRNNGNNTNDINEGMNTLEIMKNAHMIFILGADEIDYDKIHEKAIVVYIGHHGDKGASRADIILPSAAYTEKNATYVNIEGRVQEVRAATNPPGIAKEDWRIVQEIAVNNGCNFEYKNLDALRKDMMKYNDVFKTYNVISNYAEKYKALSNSGLLQEFKMAKCSSSRLLVYDKLMLDCNGYYLTNIISKHSPTMVKCSYGDDA